MKRRDFLKLLSIGAITSIPLGAAAQTTSSSAQDQASKAISEALQYAFDLEIILPESVEWIEGTSDDGACTFTEYNER